MSAWAFSSITEPNVDTGIVAVPTSPTAVPNVTASTDVRPLGFLFTNTTADAITVRVTDTSGASIVPDLQIPGHTVVPIEMPPFKYSGLSWFASGAGLNGKFEGWQ